MYLPITSPSHPRLAFFFNFSWCIQAGQTFQEIFPPQSYAKSVAAIRLSSHARCSWVKRTGLEMWAVNLGVTIHLARAHHPRWKKTLVKVTNKQLLGKVILLLLHPKLLCSDMPRVPPLPQLPTTVYFCTALLFIISSACWCAITSNHVPQDCSVSLSSCQGWSGYPACGFLRFTCGKTSSRGLSLWRCLMEEHCGIIIPHQMDKFPFTYLRCFQFLFQLLGF